MLGKLCLITLPLVAAEFDHSPWDHILKKFVNDLGEVDYAAINKDRAALDSYVQSLANSSPDNRKDLFPSREHELAYWLNAYNALVTKGVVDAYPTKSVRDIGFLFGFFRRADYTLGARKLSLQSLENDIIRKRYSEPRIHFAIVCASVSCPRLDRAAFTGPTLEAHLTRLTRQFLSERRNVFINASVNEITLSKLFDWYAKDFGDVLAFIKARAPDAVQRQIDTLRHPRVKYFDYDWSINHPGARARAGSSLERELAR